MSALASVRNEARARLWERGLSIENLSAVEWIEAVDAEVENLSVPSLTERALTSLDAEREGRRLLQALADVLMSGSAWQFIHKIKCVDEYHVVHEREGCQTCDLIDRIAERLAESRVLARAVIASGAANSQEQAQR